VPAPAARRASERVVDEPESRHAEGVDGDGPQFGSQDVVRDPQLLDQGERPGGQGRGGDDHRARRKGQRDATVVRQRQAALAERAQQRGGHRRRDERRDDEGQGRH
jgi:hypothetical protein